MKKTAESVPVTKEVHLFSKHHVIILWPFARGLKIYSQGREDVSHWHLPGGLSVKPKPQRRKSPFLLQIVMRDKEGDIWTSSVNFILGWTEQQYANQKTSRLGFSGGAVVKNLAANAGDMGSIPGPGISHKLWSN